LHLFEFLSGVGNKFDSLIPAISGTPAPKVQATNNTMESTEIEFVPTAVDVVSTKLRTWNLKHPGNMFYTNLVQQKMFSDIKTYEEDPLEYKRVAERIVDLLTVERGGRFLKLKEGAVKPTTCTVMGRKLCVNKVVHALRTAQSKQEVRNTQGNNNNNNANGTANANANANGGPPIVKKKKVSLPKVPKSNKERPGDKSQSPRPRTVPRRSAAIDCIVYRAKEGSNQHIHKHALELISLVCNQNDPSTAHYVLDKPSGAGTATATGTAGYTLENEPEKERLLRLQVSTVSYLPADDDDDDDDTIRTKIKKSEDGYDF
jgi:hypothetical protein